MFNFLVQWEGKLYPYTRLDLLRIALFENARVGLIADAIFKLVPYELTYRYEQLDEGELFAPVETPITEIETELVA